jgi:hypothetical protein
MGSLTVLVKNYIDNHRSADEGGDGVERQDEVCSGDDGHKVTD